MAKWLPHKCTDAKCGVRRGRYVPLISHRCVAECACADELVFSDRFVNVKSWSVFVFRKGSIDFDQIAHRRQCGWEATGELEMN